VSSIKTQEPFEGFSHRQRKKDDKRLSLVFFSKTTAYFNWRHATEIAAYRQHKRQFFCYQLSSSDNFMRVLL
jgi:hypothetical protein